MIESDVTLRDLLAPEKPPGDDGARPKVDASKAASSLRKTLSQEAGNIRWDLVSDVLVEKLAELLNVKLVDVLVLAWTKYDALAEFADPVRHPPQETDLVPLAEHTVRSQHQPYLEVLMDNRPVGRLTFDVTVALTLRGFLLQIQDAKIRAIQTGSCQGHACVALEKVVIYEKTFDEIPLPGTIRLGEAVSLRAGAGAG